MFSLTFLAMRLLYFLRHVSSHLTPHTSWLGMTPHASPLTPHEFSWAEVDDVLLDMDGTLLDRHFDNYLFEEELPRRYGAQQNISLEAAREHLLKLYRAVEGELKWTDLTYWTALLEVDVIALHKELDHLIGYLPEAPEFLTTLRGLGKRVHVVTNAHPSGVAIKDARTGLAGRVDGIVNAFEVGHLKTRKEYWPICRKLIGFDPARSLYVDDDEACLLAAELHGLAHIFHSSKSSSHLPPHPSRRFNSIESLSELI
jgi:FMN phosphatase YigB (HAD superfamily)